MIENFGKSNCEKYAKKYGIKNYNNFIIRNNNLVVGINGSGKTRLLSMIKDLCKEKEYLSIYMDFSQLGNKYQKVDASSLSKNDRDAFNWALLYKYANGKCEGLQDLVKFTNNSIDNLISFINKSANINFAIMRFSQINPLLMDVLGRRIVCVSNRFHITNRDNENQTIDLSKAIISMSPGERSILYFVFQLIIIESLNMEYVLLIDEPESHLHPIALVKLIKYIKEKLHPKFTIICTHSIFLLPYFNFEEIKMMDNSSINKPSSKLYNDIYENLIGFEDNENNSIYTFLTSIYEWNYSAFLAECFALPMEVSSGDIKDVQFLKLQKIIEQYSNKKEINVLDYGAGSGRIAKCFELLENDEPKLNIWSKLRYSIYDKYIVADTSFQHNKWFDENIVKISDPIKKQKKYDIILLYNVLHEIPVEQWQHTLCGLHDLLSEDGCLLFSERKVLSKGENPYGTSGYLVLEKEELSCLFGTNKIAVINIDEPKNDPTVCYAIMKKDFSYPSTTGVKKAIKKLKSRVFDIISKSLTSGKKDRKYAFYCQEYFNCLNALGELYID